MIPTEGQPLENYIKLIENQKIINGRYINIRRLSENAGKGFFSLLFTAFDKETKQNVALKFYNPVLDGELYRAECFEREINILQTFQGKPNILRLIEGKSILTINIIHDELPLQFRFQFYSTELAKSDLEYYIYSSDRNDIQNLLCFREICKSIQRIHKQKICHRDIKPSNFLLFKNRVLKLSDFGTARSFDKDAEQLLKKYTSPVGDITYTSPELLCGLYFLPNCAFCNDFYSLGSILFEMFTKINLNISIFNNIERIRELIQYFRVTKEHNRKEIYDDFIEGISKDKRLPDIFAFDNEVPQSIKDRLDNLYKSMTHLDYRKRLADFNTIFRQINICLLILENAKKYEQWRKRKKLFRKH